jgi:hypothetical protein
MVLLDQMVLAVQADRLVLRSQYHQSDPLILWDQENPRVLKVLAIQAALEIHLDPGVRSLLENQLVQWVQSDPRDQTVPDFLQVLLVQLLRADQWVQPAQCLLFDQQQVLQDRTTEV